MPVPPLKVGVIVVVPPKRTGFAAATKVAATGTGTMALLAVPAAELAPSALVAMQLRLTEPDAPAVKITLVPLAVEVRVPLVMVQAKVLPAWAGTEAT